MKNLAKTRTKNPDLVLSPMATTVALHLAEKKPSPNHPKKNLLTNHVAKKVIFLRAVKTSQTIPIAQILKLVQFQKSIPLILTKS